MATREEFINTMKALNSALNLADQCQPVMAKYLSEQDKPLLEMNELDFIGVWSNLALILQPVVNELTAVTDSSVFKEVKEMPRAHVPGLIIP